MFIACALCRRKKLSSVGIDDDLCFRLWRAGISISPRSAENPKAHLYKAQNVQEGALPWSATASCVGTRVLRAGAHRASRVEKSSMPAQHVCNSRRWHPCARACTHECTGNGECTCMLAIMKTCDRVIVNFHTSCP